MSKYGVDLGTYFLKVYLQKGEGFVYELTTGGRFTHGRYESSPLDAMYIPPPYQCEQQLIDSQTYMWTEGNFSCDCNLVGFLADSKQEKRIEEEDVPCGETNPVVKMILVRPDRTELEIYKCTL